MQQLLAVHEIQSVAVLTWNSLYTDLIWYDTGMCCPKSLCIYLAVEPVGGNVRQ